MPDNRYGPSHVPKMNEQERVEQLKEFGLETREEYVQGDETVGNIKAQRTKRVCLIFAAIFVLSLAVGILVSAFMGPGDVIAGLLIGAAVGVVIAILPMIVYLITMRKK